MPQPRIFVLCPDHNTPFGGVRKLYRQVDVLNQNGFQAWIWHQKPGFRCTWFAHDTPVVDGALPPYSISDYLVLPEVYGPLGAEHFPGVRKVVFNQGAYQTFFGYSPEPHDLRSPYTSPELVAVLVGSEDNRQYLQHVFPHLRLLRIHHGIDPSLFRFQSQKKNHIAFMPRKKPEDAVQVLNILKFRGLLQGFDQVAIVDRSQAEVARILEESLIFLSFCYQEGFPLPPCEAMLCGCIVIGYHGWGGREYFKPEFSYPIEVGDVQSFARTVERVILDYRADPTPFQRKAELARDYIRDHYSPEQEARDIVECWRTIFQLGC
jgi:glycosyltransferase involved in cell wall biosynthesis